MSTDLIDTDRNIHELVSTMPKNEIPPAYSGPWKFESKQTYFRIKYLVDRFIAISLLAILWPLIALLWLVVKATSAGSGFYSQTRVGLGGRLFKVVKLRSMRCDAEAGIPVWSCKGDRRVTPIGKILRKLHLDELPQLWNVACGDMSMVGPRPERPEITGALENFIPNYHFRHVVKPGITGLAQVNLEPDTNVNLTRKKQVLDLRYIEKSNLWLDLRLVFATCLRVVGFSGSAAMNIAKLKQEIEDHELVEVGYQFNTPEEDLWTPAKGQSKNCSLESYENAYVGE